MGISSWRKGLWNKLYDWSLVLVLCSWACHLEVEGAAFHCHMDGNKHRLEIPHLD